MDDLISRKALDDAFTGLRFNEDGTLYHWGDRPNWCMHGKEVDELIQSVPSVPAVPLDKLCEWLAAENVMIPCRACNHFENGQCGVVNDMKTPCPSGADEWRKVLEKREWKDRP